MEIADIIQWVSNEGVAIAAFFFVLIRLEKKLDEIKSSIQELSTKLS